MIDDEEDLELEPVKTATIVLTGIYEEHAEEAAFQWLLRDAAVGEPHYSLNDLAVLDNRVEAHLDGLRIAGGAGWEICKEALGEEEAGEVFAAAVMAFENGSDERIQTVLEAGSGSPELSRPLISALGWLAYPQVEGHIKNLLSSDSPELRRVGIAACAVHRQDPGPLLGEAISQDDALLRARALRAAGELGRTDLLPECISNFKADDENTRFWSAWSAALLGDPSGIGILRDIAEAGGPLAERATDLVARKADPAQALQWQKQLAAREERRRLALIAAGAIGDPVTIPWLIEMMQVAELTRVAGESFSMITGVDLAYDDLDGDRPEDFETGPTESPEDEDVDLDPDEDLPWPVPELIAGWWSDNKGKFRDGTRYLLSQPISPEHLQEVLRIGRQRQRAAAALELAITQPDQPLFEVRAPALRQKQILGLK